MLIQVVKRVETNEDWEYRDDPELRGVLEAYTCSLDAYVANILRKTCEAVGCHISLDGFIVRITQENRPRVGFSWKRRGVEFGKPLPERSDFPDMFIGFNGDLKDFEHTIIHEMLHCIGWDEFTVENKAQEIGQG